MDGPDTLWEANYTLRTLPKGLKFLRVVPPSESPKVMGLRGIHDPDALCHFNGVTHCPWCRKEGQNEGTVIYHLWTVHYGLGLMCEKCFGCLSISSETICHYSWKDCQPSGGRPQQGILISVTTSRRCTRSISPKWEPGWRIQGKFWHPLACHIGDNPCPISAALEENQMEEVPPTNPTHPITSVFPHPDQMATAFCISRTI